MLNMIYKNYDNLKPKQKKRERTFTYEEQLITQLNQIVRIDEFREKLDLDLDVAINIKLQDGIVGFTKVGDTYYTVFDIQPVGMPRKDGRPYKVVGTYLDDTQNVVTKEYVNDEDIVLWYNNATGTPENIVEFLAYMLSETDISMEYNIQRSRYNPFIRVKNQKQKVMYEEAMKATHNGEPVVIVDAEDTAFSEGEEATIDVNDVRNIDKIQYLSNFHSHLLSRFGSLYGFNMDITQKQAQETLAETNKMTAFSWLLPIDMLNQTKEFCTRFNKLYNVELVAHFGIVHELNFNNFTGDCTENDNDMNIDLEELKDELEQDNNTEEQTNNEEEIKEEQKDIEQEEKEDGED